MIALDYFQAIAIGSYRRFCLPAFTPEIIDIQDQEWDSRSRGSSLLGSPEFDFVPSGSRMWTNSARSRGFPDVYDGNAFLF